jgi:lysozyme
MDRALGFDISHYQADVDWSAVPNEYRFVAIKASEGASLVDPTFARRRDDVRLLQGRFDLVIFYHLCRPGDGAAQADRFVRLLGQLQPNERLALDTERTSTVDAAFISAFFDGLPRDRRPILYTSNGVWTGMRNPAFPQARDIDLWLPRYGTASEPVVPDPWQQIGKSWTFWQSSQSGTVPGISGPCDVNQFQGDADALRVYAAPPAVIT